MISSLGKAALSWPKRVRASFSRMGEASTLLLYACLGALVLVATIYFSFIWPQTPGRMGRASVALVPRSSFWANVASLPVSIPDTPPLVAIWLLVFTAVAFAAYGAALYVGTMRGSSRRVLLIVVGIGLLCSFANVWSLPNLNTDIFNYIVDGRVAAVYGENPYAVAADEFPDDPIYPYASHRFTDAGGDKLPLWMALNVFLARIAGNSPVTNVLTYRLALFLFNAANLALVVLTVRKLDARLVHVGAVAYAWNPVIILFAQSKTDTVMAFFVLLAAWALIVRRRWFLALIFLALSVLVKLITLPLIAVTMLRSVRLERWREVASGVLSAAVLLGLGALLLLFSEPGLLPKYLFWLQAMGPSGSSGLSRFLLFGFTLLLIAVGLVQDGNERRLLMGWAVVLLYLVYLIADFTRAWYLITVVAIVAIAVNRHMIVLLWLTSLISFLFNFWNGTFTSEFPSPDIVDIQRSLLLAVFAGALAAYLVAMVIWRRVRRQPSR